MNTLNLEEVNRGREGNTIITPTGTEVPNTIYLGHGSYAFNSNNYINLFVVNPFTHKHQRTIIHKSQLEHLCGKI